MSRCSRRGRAFTKFCFVVCDCASVMMSPAGTPLAIAAIFAATGQDIGMVGTSSMAHGAGRRVEGGLNCSIRLPGLEVATVGGGTTLPYARSWLALMGCAGAGKVYRFRDGRLEKVDTFAPVEPMP